ncbi:hypothetical protein ES319_D08G015800v1 [Gossypium barbadense]|uniref:Rieske domain-containing protein n=1 Tax=Gossypium barbadense TaxID=3634 RepID=A0A5J5QB68_GOSBA|nr:hypothetical protein ES319_D08G015800v1 [Gossypium barbadense]
MDVLRAASAIGPLPCILTTATRNKTQFPKSIFHNLNLKLPALTRNGSKSRLFMTLSSTPSSTMESIEPPMPELEADGREKERFDWYSQWYPVMPVCDLDKRVPHGKKVLGLDLVVWWDKNENEWKVFDDTCPHRLAPLSEGRIDQWGRLQCVYHGWCFNGNGDCKIIPQAPLDGPPVHTFKKACVAVYPSVVQHDIVWVWPNADPQYKDIITKKKPPYIPELDDPSFSRPMGNRDLPFGYEFLIENLMDFAHLPYAHYGIIRTPIPKVSPGNSRLIWIFPRKFGVWIDQIVPRWMFHIGVNLVLDSDLYLLHVEERKIMEIGATNWQKACFLPTKSDAMVVGFRRWFNKYAGSEIDWKGKYSGALPPSPPREQLMDRYWSHVVNCKSCNSAYKGLKALEVMLQIMSVILIGIIVVTKQKMMSMVAKTTMVSMAIICFAASKWLAHFIYKNFHYHGYNHAFH